MTRFVRLAALVVALVGLSQNSRATSITYIANLDGPSEDTPNTSPGTGFARVIYDSAAHTLNVHVTFSDLLGTTTASHIHSPTLVPLTGGAGVATTTPTFAGFPLGVTSGVYDNILDLTLASSYNPSFITANGGTTATAEAELAAGLAAGKAYLNIHSTSFTSGEIRGFLQAVPEPASVSLMAVGVLGLLFAYRRSRR